MLVKELQLLKSAEGARGVFDEEEPPRRPSRQSRRHSRLDEMGEEEEEGSEISTEGEEVAEILTKVREVVVFTLRGRSKISKFICPDKIKNVKKVY